MCWPPFALRERVSSADLRPVLAGTNPWPDSSRQPGDAYTAEHTTQHVKHISTDRDYTVRREALWSNGNKTALFHYSLKGIEESSRTFDTDIYHVHTASTSI